MGFQLVFMEIGLVALCLCYFIDGVITQPDNAHMDFGPVWMDRSGPGNRRRGNDSGTTWGGVIPTPFVPLPTEKPLTCQQRDRCSKRTPDQSFKDMNCFCDDLCQTYGDCCKDYEKQPGDRKKYRLPKGTVSCERRESILADREVYIVKLCPKNYADDMVRRNCEDERATEQFYQMPVTGTHTGVLYRNVFCAMCGGEVNVTFWNVKVICESAPTEASLPSEGTDVTTESSASILQSSLASPAKGCWMKFEPPENLPVRKCKSHVAKCDRNYNRDKKVEKKCKQQDTSLVYASSHAFKNKYCAICNFVNETYLGCEDTITPVQPTRPPGNNFEDGGVEVIPPYSLLLDINQGQGTVSNRVGHTGEQVVKEIFEVRRCPEGQVYDPFRQICIVVYCPEGYEYHSGMCNPTQAKHEEYTTNRVDRNTKSLTYTVLYLPEDTTRPLVIENRTDPFPETGRNKDIESNTKINDPTEGAKEEEEDPFSVLKCPLIMLNQSDYQYLFNGSIHIRTMDVVYGPREYTSIGPNVYICTPFTEQTYNVTTNVTTIVEMFKFSRIQSLVSLIGIIISLTALIILFIVYMMLPSLRNVPGKCLISLVVALFVAQSLFLVGTPRTEIPEVCITLAAVMHYAFLAAFLWMNVLAIDICRTFAGSAAAAASSQSVGRGGKRFAAYSFYAWVVPAVVVGGSVALDMFELHDLYRPHYGEGVCWITSRRALLTLFALPLAILLFANILLFSATIVHICAVDRMTKKALHNHYSQNHGGQGHMQKEKNRFILYIKLSFIMGLTWVFGFLAALTDIHALWYVFIAFNTLQGAFLCFAFACTKKVYRLLRQKGRVRKVTQSNSSMRYTNSYSNSTNTRLGGYSTRPTYLYDSAEARVVAQETSI